MQKPFSYKEAGVDMDKGDALVESIKKMVQSTYGAEVYQGVGGFAALYQIAPDRFLASGTDGVGTKLKIAQHLQIHNTIGIDLVAMCANDILCTGARPLFFLDYFACGKLDLAVSESIIQGIVDGCKQAQMALIGGETAEMPGMYADDEYDLAGFAVGEVDRAHLIDGSNAKEGDTLIGIASSGLHSNGFSLVRKLIAPEEKELLQEALTPTRIYCDLIHHLLQKYPHVIKGMAHITGGGFWNICRIQEKLDYLITFAPPISQIPEIFSILQKRSALSISELYETFNMGIGFVLLTDQPDKLTHALKERNETFWTLGQTQTGTGKLKLLFAETEKC